MSDDSKKQGPLNDRRINVSEPYEVHYWSEKLGVSPDELRTAVYDVGPLADDVKRRLKH